MKKKKNGTITINVHTITALYTNKVLCDYTIRIRQYHFLKIQYHMKYCIN